ncbi:MAG TPA: glycosyltransferase N-terminal domain-containing protein [Armatimonadota bacterium]|nr:glycosyltransferase N-terminal domain-containing protein [Armatimonadota bacterium]
MPDRDLAALHAYADWRTRRTRALLPWLRLKALTRGPQGRQRLSAGLGHVTPGCMCPRSCRHLVLYCHNIGEVRTALPLVVGLRKRDPMLRYVVWAKSVAAFEAAPGILPEPCAVLYAPFDGTQAVRRALERCRALALVILEGDLRPTMVWGAREAGIPTAFVSAGLSPVEMARHRGHREGQKQMLEALDLLALKSEADAQRAIELGVDRGHAWVSGNCRFDVGRLDLTPPRGPLVEFIEGARLIGRVVMVAGSTYGREERYLAEVRSAPRLAGSLLLVVAPRKPGRADEVLATFRRAGARVARRTELGTGSGPLDLPADVLVLDTMGELLTTYGLADVCFVGGSLVNKGGHNLIEAAVHGKPVLFGPSLFNNADIAARLLELDGGICVRSVGELREHMVRLLLDGPLRTSMGRAARQAVAENEGAVARTVDRLLPLIGGKTVAARAL